MKLDEQKAEQAIDKIKMSDDKREAIKNNKMGFIKQTQMMFKLYNKACKKCKTDIIRRTQSGELNKMNGEEFRELFCSRCKPKYDKVVKA